MKLLGQAALTGVSLEALLNLLRQVIPPSEVIHVGAGDGQGPLNVWHGWGLGSSVLIDANPERLSWVTDKLGGGTVVDQSGDDGSVDGQVDTAKSVSAESVIAEPFIAESEAAKSDSDESVKTKSVTAISSTDHAAMVVNAILSDKVGETTFFDLNLEGESGFVGAESLKALWPGIETVQERVVGTKTLDGVLEGRSGAGAGGEPGSGFSASENAWLFIDCLPAGLVLCGANKTLENVNLVCARVAADDVVVDGASCGEVAGVLAEVGFAQVALLAGSHPKIGYGVFCRDVVDRQQETLQSLGKRQQAESDGHRTMVQGLEADLASVKKTLAEESEAKGKLAEQVAIEKKAKDEIVVELDSHRTKVQGLEVDLASVKKTLAEESEAKAKLIEQVAIEKKAKDDLNAKVEQHKKDKAEWDARQHLYSEEMAKAEGQIDMIKDLLLNQK